MPARYPFRWTVAVAATLALAAVTSAPRPTARPAAPIPAVLAAPAEVPAPTPAAVPAPSTSISAATVAATPSPAARAERPSAQAGMVVAMDAETGVLGLPERDGTAALTIEAMQAIARAEASGLVTVRHADGSESIEHEGRFTEYTVVRIGPDGRPTFVCAHGKVGIAHAMRSARPAGGEEE